MKKNCKDTCKKKTSIGGQALIEGIMMRGPQTTAMAVRDPDGNIVLEKWRNKAAAKSKLKKMPLVRGVFGFIDSMTTGYKSLMRSAEISGLEQAEEELKREKEAKKAAKRAKQRGIASDAIEENTVVDEAAEDIAPALTVAEEAPVAEAPTQNEETPTVAEEETPTEKKIIRSEVDNTKKEKKKSSPVTNIVMVISVVLALVLSVGLFIYLPSQLYSWISPAFPKAISGNALVNSLVKSVFEGLLKIIILVGYMLCVSLMKDIRRTFMYHGAEHKTIFCYEHGKELTVENVRREGRFHPRCGTSFLVLMLIVGIFVSFLIDPLFMLISGDPKILEAKTYLLLRVAVKLVTVPLIMGIGYELIKLAGKHDNIITKIISAPGMWLQHITVLEPTDDMIECAIVAFKEVIPPDDSAPAQDAEPAPATDPEISPDTDIASSEKE